MKAIILRQPGPVENLIFTDLPVPSITDGEVLVRATAISINPVDAKTRAGKGMYEKLKDQHPLIPGWDLSGFVAESRSPLFKTGDEVFGMVNFPGHGKAYAEYVAAPASHLTGKPAAVSHTDAAVATLAALTAWQALITHAGIKAGDRVLIHAAAGGVGHYAVQFAKHLGAYVIGTASAANRDFVLSLGADEHIDYKAQRFEEVVHNLDFVLDTIGGDNIDRSLPSIKKGGTIICLPSGLNELVTEKAAAKGIRGYPIRVQSNGEDMRQLAGLLEKGIVRSHVSQIFPFDEMREAHRKIETGKTRGKIALEL